MLSYPLSTLIILPWLGALLVALVRRPTLARLLASGVSLLVVCWTAYVWMRFLPDRAGGLQLAERLGPWIAGFDVSYYVALDGLNLPFLVMVALLGFLVIWGSWAVPRAHEAAYYALLLLLMGALFGAFLAVDLVLFYVFFELTLIPAFFLIGLWGRQEAWGAALRFLLYTLVGSLLLLVAILYVGVEAGRAFNNSVFTADWLRISRQYLPELKEQYWLLGAFALAFVIKAGLVPVHAWLPAAYAEGPPLLIGLSKLGVYGMLRWGAPLFPSAWEGLVSMGAILGLLSVLYGGLLAYSERDARRALAYGSIAHMGLLFLGLSATTAEAWQGVIWQAVMSTWIVAGLFVLLADLERRLGGLLAPELYGGWAGPLPLQAAFFGVLVLAFIGLPGLAGFVGEWLILLGAFRSPLLDSGWYAAIAASGVVLAAVYMLRLFERLFWGPLKRVPNPGPSWGLFGLLPALALVLGFGLAPRYGLYRSEAQLTYLLELRAQRVQQLQESNRRSDRLLPSPDPVATDGMVFPR
ncbi:MAG: NADH-quinone oxidoreductase subunit M [Bacteroidetes bacterium]|nr:NADH-quinone oxidoreductase subunit M [Bacteroidota bacterium]